MATDRRGQASGRKKIAETAAVQKERIYQVQFATQIPAARLNRFFDRMFPSRSAFLKERWQWLYRVGKCEWAPSPLVVVSDERIIGYVGTIPITLDWNGAKLPAVWLVDMAVLPEYQRHGIGIALFQASMEKGSLHMGFCNERSMGAALKCGWRLRSHTYSFQLLLSPEFHPKVQQSPFAPVGKITGLATRMVWGARTTSHNQAQVTPASPDNLSEFSLRYEAYGLHVLRSREFLQWRTMDHPRAGEHFIFSLPGREGEGCSAIVRLAETEGYRRLHILTLAGDLRNQNELSDFFASIVRWALQEGYHRILMVASDPGVSKAAMRWFPVATRLRFIYHTSDSDLDRVLCEADHMWECIDNDFDLSQ